MQLNSKNEICKNFVFRLGELHIIFAYLKVIGKYIENSGLDQVFLEANIYGPIALSQILKGKHMKRAPQAYMCVYLAICKRDKSSFLEHTPTLEDKILPEAKLHLFCANENITSVVV